jgi:hypothetical protein
MRGKPRDTRPRRVPSSSTRDTSSTLPIRAMDRRAGWCAHVRAKWAEALWQLVTFPGLPTHAPGRALASSNRKRVPPGAVVCSAEQVGTDLSTPASLSAAVPPASGRRPSAFPKPQPPLGLLFPATCCRGGRWPTSRPGVAVPQPKQVVVVT